MSEMTFNIADYRPLDRAGSRHPIPLVRARNAFVVLSSNSEPRENEAEWFNRCPGVVDIRSMRESHRSVARRGKILRFSNPASHRVYMMPAQGARMPEDDDPDPMVA